jgi:eukaryotic-like serine/threonine-protein kinase
MGSNNPPNHAPDLSRDGSSDRTQSAGAADGAPAGKIGPYRLLQLLGEGGMGEVWLAEQKIPIHRTVALKLIKSGMDTKAVVARFESERQALALMDHSNIARVFDAGSTPEGRPYFVMEYVPGLPITEHCDKHRLTIQERLKLFLQVCDGVQHAHQKAIIHRDLKPSNVLVVEQDNEPVPKIIDFGLAKATAQRLTDKTMFTELGVMMGTPEYMSPEQADQREQNIDTRTDVYSLGVILYQLLVGALPFEVKALRAQGLEAILRAIREQEPPKPSTRIRSMGPASAESAEKRKEEPRSFARHLQGELDWITMKALEKDRNRRYESPAELRADIGRHLHNEPVLAHPPSAGYRASKFVRRHRFGVAAAGVALVLLIAFAGAMAVEARRIASERDRANRQAEAAQRVADFMKDMFKVSDPSEARGNSVTAREILDKASEDVDIGLAKDPQTQAQLMDIMGEVYESLGLYPRAEPLLKHAVNIQQRVLGPRNSETLSSEDDLTWLLFLEGRYAEAEELGQKALDIHRQVSGREHPDTLISMRHLAAILNEEGRFTEAERMERELLDIENRVLGPEHTTTLSTIGELAFTVQSEGNNAEAEKMFRQLLDTQRRVLGPEHPATLATISNLAANLAIEGNYTEAEKMRRESLDIERRVLGPEHPSTLMTINNLADTLEKEGRYAEAEKMEREALDIGRRVLAPDHPTTAVSIYNLGVLAAHQSRKDEAFSLLRQAVDHGLPPYADLGIDTDPDVEPLHGDPRFVALVADAKQKAAAVQKPR